MGEKAHKTLFHYNQFSLEVLHFTCVPVILKIITQNPEIIRVVLNRELSSVDPGQRLDERPLQNTRFAIQRKAMSNHLSMSRLENPMRL